jgi:hypothetical protein
MSKNTSSTVVTSSTTKGNNTSTKGNSTTMDNNSIVCNGATISKATVTQKLPQAVVLAYEVNGKSCSGVMHVSQFPSLDRQTRDKIFTTTEVGSEFNDLIAEVEPADKTKGRHFTSVRLSARAALVQAAEQQRQAAQAAREEKEKAYEQAVKASDGQVVIATVKSLAFSKDQQTKKETDHCFGAFLKATVQGVEVSGLLHVSRMQGRDRVERLAGSFTAGTTFEVLATMTEKGLSFSEHGVKAAKEAAAAAQRAAAKADESSKFLACIREALAAGKGAKTPFPAKVVENGLESGAGIVAEVCSVRVEVSAADLDMQPKHLRGTGHQLKLVALAVSDDGVITGKRYTK